MIGNDIIDLTQTRAESNWKRKGFLEKIFTEKEQLLILAAANQEVMVWNLWSRKEAAYKIYNRQTGERAFNPKRIECFNIVNEKDQLFGLVKIDRFIYLTRTQVKGFKIYTDAVTNLDDFHIIKEIDSKNIYKDCSGIPHATVTNNPVSITHHGRFERCIQLDIYTQSRL